MTDTDKKINEWVHQRMYGSVIARNTECWNFLMIELEALKASLRGEAPPAAKPTVDETFKGP